MKIIINCSPDNLEAAFDLAREQTAGDWQRRYDRPGWGWNYCIRGTTFFARGIKDGISITEMRP